MAIEAVLLAGGKSARMGVEKASLQIAGRPLAHKMVEELLKVCQPVTVLGGAPAPGAAHLPDSEPFGGPLAALSRFEPRQDRVFVASCDLPLFRSEAVAALDVVLGEADAAVPQLASRAQPLCAVYRRLVFSEFRRKFESGERALQAAFGGLNVRFVSEAELTELGVDPRWVQGANTPEELQLLLASEGAPGF